MIKLRKLALAGLVAASFSAVNVYASNAVPAPAPVQEPATQQTSSDQKTQLEQQGKLILFKVKYSENNSEVFIPQIEGIKDTALQNTINNTLKTSLISPNTSLKGDFEVPFYNEKLLGIHFHGVSSTTKETQPISVDKSIYIDLTTGKIYKLEDLFKPVDFERTIKKICFANDSNLRITNTAQPSRWTYKDFANTWNKETGSFVLLGDSIMVYSVQPQGTIGYKIPYSELKNIINTNGALWNNLQEQAVKF